MEKKNSRMGKGNVVFNGRVMTGDDYKNAIVRTLKDNDGKWMTTAEIIKHASKKGYCEGEDYPRKAVSHPLYKTLSDMMDKDLTRVIARMDRDGDWEYKLTKPNVIYRNGEQLFIIKK